MRPDPDTDHVEIAWQNTLKQHMGREYLEAFYRSIFAPFNDLQQVFVDLLDKRKLNTAEGAQLDGIGVIVGIKREIPQSVYLPFFGYASQEAGRAYRKARYRREGEAFAMSSLMPDAEYRKLIRAKIVLNNSHATINDMIRTVRLIYGRSNVRVFNRGNASFDLYIDVIPPPADSFFAYLERLITAAAGVKMNVIYFRNTLVFGYQGQPGVTGYNLGPYARSTPSNIDPIF